MRPNKNNKKSSQLVVPHQLWWKLSRCQWLQHTLTHTIHMTTNLAFKGFLLNTQDILNKTLLSKVITKITWTALKKSHKISLLPRKKLLKRRSLKRLLNEEIQMALRPHQRSLQLLWKKRLKAGAEAVPRLKHHNQWHIIKATPRYHLLFLQQRLHSHRLKTCRVILMKRYHKRKKSSRKLLLRRKRGQIKIHRWHFRRV